MLDLRRQADAYSSGSLSNTMRARRFGLFERLVEHVPRPLRLIDVGGTADFWQKRGWIGRDDVSITAVNLQGDEGELDNFRMVRADATDLASFANDELDVAFSNSVIEHLFTERNQTLMAGEIMRVAKAFWVQTPSFWFPIEPHFHVPGWQWLPKNLRVKILQRRRCGWRGPCPDPEEALAAVEEVRLMTKRELHRAFPGACIWCERYMGLTKSYVVYDGFGRAVEEVEGLAEPASTTAGSTDRANRPERT